MNFAMRGELRGMRFQFLLRCLLALMLLAFSLPAAAEKPSQEVSAGEPADVPEEARVLSPEQAEKFDKMLAGLDSEREQIATLEKSIESNTGTSKQILQLRLAKSWLHLLQDGNKFASTVYASRDNGARQSKYWDPAIAELNAHLAIAEYAGPKLASKISVPPEDMPPVEKAVAYARNADLVKIQDKLFNLMFDSLSLSTQYELDVAAEQAFLKNGLRERAENNSVLLDLAMNDVANHRAALTVLPDDKDLQAQLAVAKGRVSNLADSLQTTVSFMKKLDLDTSSYNRQIISGTGQISSDTVSVSVLSAFVAQSTVQLRNWIMNEGPDILLKLLLFAIVLLAAIKLSHIVGRLIEAGIDRANVDISQLLRKMLVSVGSKLVLVVGVLLALSQIGISLGPVLAGMGVAGFVIGFALQDTLSNFASGMMILFYRPFDVGDVVEAGGVAGTVAHMSLVSTTILTFDNQTLVVPNNKIWGNVIKNVTAQRTRRVDLIFSISYDADINAAEKILQDIVSADKRVLAQPEPVIKLHQLADSSVNFVVRPWVSTGDYWDVYWDITRSVKQRFDASGITIPFPQMTVHMEKPESPAALPAPVGKGA
jgi:small conductance mechanosensitive channel